MRRPVRVQRWLGKLRRLGVPPLFSSAEVKRQSVATILHIPTSDGSGEACHPSVVEVPEGFGGYRYWMANTPYCAHARKLENPEIFASADGVFWTVPDGLTNPIVRPPDGDRRHYHSDPCLLEDEGRLRLYFRTSNEEAKPRCDVISAMSSRDGIVWSEPQSVLCDNGGGLLLCPVVRRVAGEFLLWTVEKTHEPHLEVVLRRSGNGFDWSAPVAMPLREAPLALEPWHIDVVPLREEWIMIFSGRTPGTRSNQRFYWARSTGEEWIVQPPITATNSAFEQGKAYKPSLLMPAAGRSALNLYTSSVGADGRWYTALRSLLELPPRH